MGLAGGQWAHLDLNRMSMAPCRGPAAPACHTTPEEPIAGWTGPIAGLCRLRRMRCGVQTNDQVLAGLSTSSGAPVLRSLPRSRSDCPIANSNCAGCQLASAFDTAPVHQQQLTLQHRRQLS